jgi:tryptophan-rich sensory protein
VNLALNTGWNQAVFRRRSPAAGLAVTAALDASNLALIRRVGRSDRSSALGLAPYASWCAFATALNASIAWRNRPTR